MGTLFHADICWPIVRNRKSKLAFADTNGGSTDQTPGVLIFGRSVPVSIAVIAVVYLTGAVFGLVMTFRVPANIFLGVVVTGIAAKLLTLVVALAGVYIGVGLLTKTLRQ